MTRRRAYAIVIAVCALPRLVVLVHERASILRELREVAASSRRCISANGTFGYVPGHPSAYTQPLYGCFLIPIFWIAGFHWWSVGTVQILVAVATSICRLRDRPALPLARIGLMAAVIATLQPYLVWHDLHGNREILDQLLGAAMFGLTLLAVAPPSVWTGVALGVVSGSRSSRTPGSLALPARARRLRALARRGLGRGASRCRSSRWSRSPRG